MFKTVVTPEMHYDDWAEQYDRDVKGWSYHAPDRILAGIRNDLTQMPQTPKILDVGIGTGFLSRKCRVLRSDLHITGVDISTKMMKVCQRRGGADELHHVDISRQTLPYEEGRFDLAIAAGLMENVENIGNAIREMTRVVRPGGLIAFTYMPTTRHPLRESLAMKLRPGRTDEGRLVLGNLILYRHNPDIVRAHARAAGAVEQVVESFIGYRTYVVMTVRYDLFLGRKISGLQ